MAEDENSLYYIIRQGKVSLQVITLRSVHDAAARREADSDG
jgi:hypothetical protein